MEIYGLGDIPLSLLLMVVLFVFIYVYQTWHFNMWRSLSIAGPAPRIFLGSLPIAKEVDMLGFMEKCKNKYGPTYGMFFFRRPCLVTSDPEFIKEVGIRQFNNFTDRTSGFDVLLSEFSWKMLFNSLVPAWRRYRHVMSPAFTTGKLKAIQHYIVRYSQILTEVLKDKASKGEDIVIKDTYQRFTMDVIAGTAFGLDTDLQRVGDKEDTPALIRAMRGVVSNLTNQLAIFIAVSFPFLGPVLRALGYAAMPKKDVDFFKQCITDIIRHRDHNPQEAEKRVDFLQQMMDIRVAEGEEVTDSESLHWDKTNKKLTEEEVLAQSIQIFLAGFETTASTLRYLTYRLALNPEVQEKVLQEVADVVGDGEVKYEHLQHLKYVECVIRETLRMYPVLPVIIRKAKDDISIQGYSVPQGVGVVLDIYTAAHDPDIYPDPNSFNPDRFLEAKDSVMTSLPFGLGPRQCLGTRLALQEMKTVVATVCRAVRFLPCPDTPKTLDLDGFGLLIPKQPIIVRAEMRT